MIVAMVALIAALAGTAFAGGFVTKKKVNKIITNRAPSLAVGSAKSADTAKNATTATTATNADNATTANSAKNVLWAVVSDAGTGTAATLARSNVPVTVTDATGVDVDFGRNVAGCAWIATKGSANTTTSVAGEVNTQGTVGNPNAVNVRTRSSNGTLDERDFHLEVIC
jgi:hypothetical protein